MEIPDSKNKIDIQEKYSIKSRDGRNEDQDDRKIDGSEEEDEGGNESADQTRAFFVLALLDFTAGLAACVSGADVHVPKASVSRLE